MEGPHEKMVSRTAGAAVLASTALRNCGGVLDRHVLLLVHSFISRGTRYTKSETTKFEDTRCWISGIPSHTIFSEALYELGVLHCFYSSYLELVGHARILGS